MGRFVEYAATSIESGRPVHLPVARGTVERPRKPRPGRRGLHASSVRRLRERDGRVDRGRMDALGRALRRALPGRIHGAVALHVGPRHRDQGAAPTDRRASRGANLRRGGGPRPVRRPPRRRPRHRSQSVPAASGLGGGRRPRHPPLRPERAVAVRVSAVAGAGQPDAVRAFHRVPRRQLVPHAVGVRPCGRHDERRSRRRPPSALVAGVRCRRRRRQPLSGTPGRSEGRRPARSSRAASGSGGRRGHRRVVPGRPVVERAAPPGRPRGHEARLPPTAPRRLRAVVERQRRPPALAGGSAVDGSRSGEARVRRGSAGVLPPLCRPPPLPRHRDPPDVRDPPLDGRRTGAADGRRVDSRGSRLSRRPALGYSSGGRNHGCRRRARGCLRETGHPAGSQVGPRARPVELDPEELRRAPGG